jgi:hypothetical protein
MKAKTDMTRILRLRPIQSDNGLATRLPRIAPACCFASSGQYFAILRIANCNEDGHTITLTRFAERLALFLPRPYSLEEY